MSGNITQFLFDRWNGVEQPKGNREDYLEKLKSGVWLVQFTKVDGTPSVMEVTLDPSIIPVTEQLTEGKGRPEQPHLISAYSPDRGGWRSFTVANVTDFQPHANRFQILRIDEILVNHLGVDPSQIRPENTFAYLGCDSLDVVEIVMALEDEFNLDITDEEAERILTVQDLYDFVAKRVS